MNYVDLRSIKEPKIRTQIIINTAYGCQDYDYVRLDDRTYIMSKSAIYRMHRGLRRTGIKSRTYIMKDICSVDNTYLIVEIINGALFTMNYSNLIVEIARKLTDKEVY